MIDQDADKLRQQVSLKWAFKAYDRFAERLSPDVQRHLGVRRKEAYTVVFGRTQVGKSTLILHLLGVRADAIGSVSDVLRGGRKAGNSSTALPTEYRRSRDNCWRIAWGGRSWLCISDDEARNNLGKARAAMEADIALVDDALCSVDIPTRYLEAASLDLRGTRVLDLPGMDAANHAERRFVTRIAESLVPNADLILLVGRADDLTFLMADQLALPGVSDWQITPRRFRVVTTYSFTPASVQEFAREHDCRGDLGKYRERLIGEIQRFRPLEPSAQIPDLYFPLEFGESWKRASDLHSPEMTAMMDGLMQRLREDIATASTPIGRLEGALEAHVLITAAHARNLEKIGKRQDKIQYAVQAREGVVRQLESTIQQQRDRLSARRVGVEGLSDADIAKTATATGDELHKMTMEWRRSQLEQLAHQVKKPDRHTDFLLSLLGEAEDSLRRQISKAVRNVTMPKGLSRTFWSKIQESASRPTATYVAEAAHEVFSEVRGILGGYWIKYYVRDGAYQQDLSKITAAYMRLIGIVKTHLAQNIAAEIQATKNMMQADARRLEMKIIETGQSLAKEGLALKRLQEQLQVCQVERDEANRSNREEMALSLQFTRLLAEEYDKAVEKAHADVMEAADPPTAFEHLVMASMLRKSHESVWTRISGAMTE